MTPTRLPLRRLLAVVMALGLAACGDDSGADPFDGGGEIVDAEPGLTDGAYLDGGLWYCGSVPCACNDGMDNDLDGFIDLMDPACGAPSDNAESFNFTPGSTQCTDLQDNDGDGLTDSQDPECTGALDNDEGSFATGIPGDNMDECHQDCWFDGDSGSGNDGCRWLLGCDPVAGAHYSCNLMDPSSNNCTRQQTQECIDFCSQYTPNGCDCFGCCDVFVGGTLYTVLLSETCSSQVITDTNLCVPCTKVPDCNNPCDPCEFCLGHVPEDGCTPAGSDGPPAGGCPTGQNPCDPLDPDMTGCTSTEFCLTGCCVPAID